MSGPSAAHNAEPLMKLPPIKPTPCNVNTTPATMTTIATALMTMRTSYEAPRAMVSSTSVARAANSFLSRSSWSA